MPIEPIPSDTARVGRAAFPRGNRYLRVADELDTLCTDEALMGLFPTHGQPAVPPWRLALVTLLPCAEGLSDRQAAEAVRSRIDWTYMLRLERTDAGFAASVLRACRGRQIAGTTASLLFETLLTWCRSRPLVKARGRQRTDSTHIFAAVRALNRIEVVGDTRRHALHTLAVVAPEWWRAVSPQIHATLEQRGLLPGTHIVDTGFLDADLLVKSRDDDSVDLLGPTRLDDYWQAQEGAGVDVQHVQIDWDRQHATCPTGQTSLSWTPLLDTRGHPVIQVRCSTTDGRRCEQVTQCIRSTKRDPRRTLTLTCRTLVLRR